MSAFIEVASAGYAVGSKPLVTDVSLEVASGCVSVVIGPNGAGKSTLLRLISGEIRPLSGAVRYGGEPAHLIPPWRLAALRAVLPQASRLAFPFTVREVVRIGLDGMGRGLSARDRDGLLAEALGRADMTPFADRAYQTLSGGEQQRAQFARVVAQLMAGRTLVDRQVLLLDEPVASLDLKHQLALLESCAALAREGVAVVAILHDLNLAAAFADEIVVMDRGRVAAHGRPRDVIDDRVVARVFEVDLKVGQVPPGGAPFVLPSRART